MKKLGVDIQDMDLKFIIDAVVEAQKRIYSIKAEIAREKTGTTKELIKKALKMNLNSRIKKDNFFYKRELDEVVNKYQARIMSEVMKPLIVKLEKTITSIRSFYNQ